MISGLCHSHTEKLCERTAAGNYSHMTFSVFIFLLKKWRKVDGGFRFVFQPIGSEDRSQMKAVGNENWLKTLGKRYNCCCSFCRWACATNLILCWLNEPNLVWQIDRLTMFGRDSQKSDRSLDIENWSITMFLTDNDMNSIITRKWYANELLE